MSITTTLSDKQYSELSGFAQDIEIGVTQQIETALAPIRQTIIELQNELAVVKASIESIQSTTVI
jgi:hypothetical protein